MTAPGGRGRESILVVDDDPAVVAYLVEALAEAGYRADGVTSAAEALGRVRAARPDLVISDVEMPGMRGVELLPRLLEERPGQLILLITAFGSIEMAVDALRAGAADFVSKPFKIEVLLAAIERVFKERRMRREIIRLRRRLAADPVGGLVAQSERMRQVVEIARRVAPTDVTVLLTGESGVGKGAVARFLHDQGARARRPFVQVNCAALPAPLVESEFFGVRKGAYTDARDHRDGLFVDASGGSLFLDEIGEMPIEAQAKLLHALESGRIRPVGATDEVAVDVRLIAATNRPLEEALRDGRFRPDLYFRLNVVRLEIPPLRDRREDLPDLVDLFLQRACARFGRSLIGVSDAAMSWLLRHPWPGNVRELANTIERAVALAEHDALVIDDLHAPAPAAPPATTEAALVAAVEQGLTLAEVERAYLQAAVAVHDGNMARAARAAGIDRRTLYRKLGDADDDGDARSRASAASAASRSPVRK
jgi:DNA-binding NtrC family response regulator